MPLTRTGWPCPVCPANRNSLKSRTRSFGALPAFPDAVNIRRFTLLLLTAAFAFAAKPKVASDLGSVAPTKQVDVIVRFTHLPQASDHAAVAAAGGALKRNLTLVRSAVYSMPAAAIDGLSHN